MLTLQIIRYDVDTPKHLTAIANYSSVSAVTHNIRGQGTAVGHEIKDLSRVQAQVRHLLTYPTHVEQPHDPFLAKSQPCNLVETRFPSLIPWPLAHLGRTPTQEVEPKAGQATTCETRYYTRYQAHRGEGRGEGERAGPYDRIGEIGH